MLNIGLARPEVVLLAAKKGHRYKYLLTALCSSLHQPEFRRYQRL